ncbi:hypothetical protein F66182_7044 [Fusarium sp. NRRL 66182]|nr:hypothetical protein F66182_7044 [Fusarium sp. NRRL 66182]
MDALDQVHPDLVDLMIRLDLLPSGEGAGFTESNLARLIMLAIELADPVEQALLVSRIIPEEDLAAERLRSAQVRNTNHRVVLDRAEKKAVLAEEAPELGQEAQNGQDCIICSESAHVKVPCGCNYCLSCFREAIRVGLRSQGEFPPKCCEPFTEATIALARSPALVHLFRQMQEEAQTPVPSRLYCHDGNCAAFIPPHRNGECLVCGLGTCDECGSRAHPGQPCAEGHAEEDVWATMDANHVVNCPRCTTNIQLSEACNHMTCNCGKEFCFICGKTWHTCHCPIYGGFHRMVPMRHRPGNKTPQFRRRPHREEETAGQGGLKIPQLRPLWEGDEARMPRVEERQRVIRPLALPRLEERPRRERRREDGGRFHHALPEAYGGLLPIGDLPPGELPLIQELPDYPPFPGMLPMRGRQAIQVIHEHPRPRRRETIQAVHQPFIRQPVVRDPATWQPAQQAPPRRHTLRAPAMPREDQPNPFAPQLREPEARGRRRTLEEPGVYGDNEGPRRQRDDFERLRARHERHRAPQHREDQTGARIDYPGLTFTERLEREGFGREAHEFNERLRPRSQRAVGSVQLEAEAIIITTTAMANIMVTFIIIIMVVATNIIMTIIIIIMVITMTLGTKLSLKMRFMDLGTIAIDITAIKQP